MVRIEEVAAGINRRVIQDIFGFFDFLYVLGLTTPHFMTGLHAKVLSSMTLQFLTYMMG